MIPLLGLLVLTWAGCASGTKPEPAATVVPVQAKAGWVRTELYFALGGWEETALSTEPEERWAKFLDTEVTPRFPDGLSVIDVYGQWRSRKAGATLQRERSRLLVILHPATEDASAKIEEIRKAWKRPTGEESVLRVSQPADVGF